MNRHRFRGTLAPISLLVLSRSFPSLHSSLSLSFSLDFLDLPELTTVTPQLIGDREVALIPVLFQATETWTPTRGSFSSEE